MVVTLTLESPEARTAVAAARQTGDLLLLVPRLENRYASVGVVATIEDSGKLQNGMEALVIRALHRAQIGTGVAGTGDATWVQVTEADEQNADTSRARELARDYRATVENIVEARGVPQVAEMLRGITDPSALADTAGYSPDLSMEQRVEILETLDVEQRLGKVTGWAKDTLAEISVKDRIREEVAEGLDKRQREFILRQQMDAIRKELGEDDEENVVAEYRTRIAEAN